MSRGAVNRPPIRPVIAQGGLRYETLEVRGLLQQHWEVMQPQGESRQRVRAMQRGGLLFSRSVSEMQKMAGLAPHEEALDCPPHPDPAVPNRKLARLAAELGKYCHALGLESDRINRAAHVAWLKEILSDHETRAWRLLKVGQAPPLHVIVAAESMSTAGMNRGEIRASCDRAIGWKFWQWTTYDERMGSAAACARDQNAVMTGIRIPTPWLVTSHAALEKLQKRVV